MREMILELKRDRQVFAFAVLGLILVLFPEGVEAQLPYILGVVMLIYAAVNLVVCFRYPDSEVRMGKSLLMGALGVVVCLQKAESIGTLGIIWAILSLQDTAEELEDYRRTKIIRPINVIGIIVSVILAVLLLLAPFEHFSMHIRVLGLEMISAVFIRRRMDAAQTAEGLRS